MTLAQRLTDVIRIIPDFPKAGISFKDITPIFHDPILVRDCAQALAEPFRAVGINKVIGIESRGFLLGPMIAQELSCAFVMVRKKGKLPADTYAVSYELEYGNATIEVHRDAIEPGDRVIIHDDLLATGGTAAAAAQLCRQTDAEVAGFAFIVALTFLGGADKLNPFSAHQVSLVRN
jgi:adenine phosphoribosyltransferase